MQKRCSLVFTLLVLGLLASGSVRADGPEVGTSPPSLGSVVWGTQGTSFEALKGKTVVVITYVTWCPICNGWSKEALRNVPKEIADKPIVVLAISTDTPPQKAQPYLKDRGLIGPQVLVGYDPTIATRFGFSNKFFNYAIIGPDSKVVASGNVGSHYPNADGSKTYVLEKELSSRTDFGQFQFLTDEMSDSLKKLVFPMELGFYPTAADSARMKQSLKAADREAFEKMLNTFLDERLADAKQQSEGEAPDKISAFETASYLSLTFKATEQGKEAKKLVTELAKDKNLKKELSAKRAYDDLMKLPAADPARQAGLRSFTKKFADTHYAKVASGIEVDD